MLDRETNELLCRVGPETPMGELLRRYWMPIGPKAEIDEMIKRPVRLLGEDLLVFKDGQGRYGLLAEECSHRGASLCYGKVEQDGIRCPYHGWKYDVNGNCVEQPAETPETTSKNAIRHRAYPVQELAGLLFGYLGPSPAPLLPRYDVLVKPGCVRQIEIRPVHECNWLQPMENTIDPAHFYWLHAYAGGFQADGRNDLEDEKFEVEIFEYGLYKYHHRPKTIEVHPLVFPNMRRGPQNAMHFYIPMDDTHTGIISVKYRKAEDGSLKGEEVVPYRYLPPIKEDFSDNGFPRHKYSMKTIPDQDGMAWETQGPMADRTKEHLGSSDKGLVMFRQMLRLQIEAVKKGEDPIGVVRDAQKNNIIEFKVGEMDKETGRDVTRVRTF